MVRTDLLDYAFEIEYFGRRLGTRLDLLEKRGGLANTLVVVTSDQGMDVPRVVGQIYDLSILMPLAIMWREELYRLSADPSNVVTLAEQPQYEPRATQLKNRLFGQLREQGDPRMAGRGAVFDEYPYARASRRDFYERYMRGEVDRSVVGWVNPSDFESNFPDSLR